MASAEMLTILVEVVTKLESLVKSLGHDPEAEETEIVEDLTILVAQMQDLGILGDQLLEVVVLQLLRASYNTNFMSFFQLYYNISCNSFSLYQTQGTTY
jgi:hypothetical protein